MYETVCDQDASVTGKVVIAVSGKTLGFVKYLPCARYSPSSVADLMSDLPFLSNEVARRVTGIVTVHEKVYKLTTIDLVLF